jgi:hypothetical protein
MNCARVDRLACCTRCIRSELRITDYPSINQYIIRNEFGHAKSVNIRYQSVIFRDRLRGKIPRKFRILLKNVPG